MATECYCCTQSAGTTTGDAYGNQTEPVAACELCHSFICALHGQRDANQKYWRCVLCLTALIGSAAIRRSQRPTLVTRLVAHALAPPDLRYDYASLGEFVERNPSFEWVYNAAETVLAFVQERVGGASPELANAWDALDEDGRLMLAASFALAQRLQLRRNDVPEYLRLIAEGLGWVWPQED